VTRIGDGDRERARAQLCEHFVQGRLSVEELDERVERAFAARTTVELRRAFKGLPDDRRPSLLRALARGAALVVATGAWLGLSLVVAIVLLIALVFDGPSLVLAAVAAAWVVPTFVLVRVWRRALSHRISGV
jgi:Flp pilus assembly protein TadB